MNLNKSQEILLQIELLCSSVQQSTYNQTLKQGRALLAELHKCGLRSHAVYQALFVCHNSLDDSPSHDFAADLLDFVAGWCSLQNSIW